MLAIAYVTLQTAGDTNAERDAALRQVTELVDSVRMASFPQLRGLPITVQEMSSDYVYMESRFTLTSFFLRRRLRYLMLFNRAALARRVPQHGLRAILAHELAHVDYFESHSRMGLFSLVQLLSARFNARFERSADLEAIELGYGPGLHPIEPGFITMFLRAGWRRRSGTIFRRLKSRQFCGQRSRIRRSSKPFPDAYLGILARLNDKRRIRARLARTRPQSLTEATAWRR